MANNKKNGTSANVNNNAPSLGASNNNLTQQVMNTTNRQQLNNVVKGAREEVKSVSILYYVHQLNKLARKNEFVEGVNIKELGTMLRAQLSSELYNNNKELFTARCFTKDSNARPCFVARSKKCPKWGLDLVQVSPNGWDYLKPVNLSLSGLVSAYRAILAPAAAAADKAKREEERAAHKEERAKESKARAAARKAIREQQQQARIDYNNGKLSLEQFAAIMAKVA